MTNIIFTIILYAIMYRNVITAIFIVTIIALVIIILLSQRKASNDQ